MTILPARKTHMRWNKINLSLNYLGGLSVEWLLEEYYEEYINCIIIVGMIDEEYYDTITCIHVVIPVVIITIFYPIFYPGDPSSNLDNMSQVSMTMFLQC